MACAHRNAPLSKLAAVRIAFLANPVYDYLQDVVFHGLASLLGPKNVVEFPPLPRYHGVRPAETDYPQLCFDFPEPPRASFRELIESSDAVVVGSLRSGIRALIGELLDLEERPPVVHLDGEDDFFVRAVQSHVDVYCKREILVRGRLAAWRHALRRHSSADPLNGFARVARAGDRAL